MKRFIDTELMLRPWFRNLPPHLKCLWLWMLTRCDMAGVLHMDWALASFAIGERVTEDDLQAMKDNIIVIGRNKLLLPSYIHFQYGELKDESRVHQGVLRCLASHGIQYPIDSLLAKPDSLSETSDRLKAKDKDKDNKIGGVGGKKPYGEFGNVRLTDEEYAKLVEQQGEEKAKRGIAILDDYIESKGKKYRSHYATMKPTGWVWERLAQAGNKPQQQTLYKDREYGLTRPGDDWVVNKGGELKKCNE